LLANVVIQEENVINFIDLEYGQAWKFCIFWERRSEPKKIQEPKKTKKKEMKRGERERKEKRGERE